MAALAMDYPDGGQRSSMTGVRYADSIEQSTAPTSCARPRRSSRGPAPIGPTRPSGAPGDRRRGCRRGAEIARLALGYGRARAWRPRRRPKPSSPTVLRVRRAERGDRAHPAAAVGPGRGRPAGRRPGRAMALCRDALAARPRSASGSCSCPFVVTGVRAALAGPAGRGGARGSTLCAAHLEPIAAVAAPALDHGRGLVALADGATGIARTALEAAVHGWDATAASGRRPGRAWTWPVPGPLEPVRGGARLAVDARGTASRLDAPALAARADALQRMARGRVADEEPWRPLTAREFAVARLIAEGHDQRRDRGRRSGSPRRPRAATSSTSWPSSGHPAAPRSRRGPATSSGAPSSTDPRRPRRPGAVRPPRRRHPRPTRNLGTPDGDGTISPYHPTHLTGAAPHDRGPVTPTPEGTDGHRHPSRRPPASRGEALHLRVGRRPRRGRRRRCATCSAARARASPR